MSRRRTARLAAVLALCLCATALATPSAGASTLQGAAFSGTSRVAGVAVHLWKWDGSRAVYLGRGAYTNSSGYYSMTIPGSTWYYVQGVKVIGSYCYPYGRLYQFDGYSN